MCVKTATKKFNVGDTVWYNSCGYVEKATILEMRKVEVHGGQMELAKCKPKIGVCERPTSALYKTAQECLDAMKRESERIKNEYRKEINSVEDLVVFMFNHDVSYCEYQDSDAREVAIEKAKELLGMSESKILDKW